MKTKITFCDILIVIAVGLVAALLALIPLIRPNDGQYLSVTVRNGNDNRTVNYPLATDTEFELTNNGITLRVKIENGSAEVVESDCDDLVCLNSARISRRGQSIVCAPGGIALTVIGGDGDHDATAG